MKVRKVTRRNINRLFESRKAHLDYRIKRDYISNGIATIPCQISSYSDVISVYSVKGYETLNPDFADYVKSAADVTPPEYPLVLNIIGDRLSEHEKTTIEETIRDEFAYDLGIVEKEEKRHRQIFSGMFIGLILLTIILCITQTLAEEPRELIFIMFYFMGDPADRRLLPQSGGGLQDRQVQRDHLRAGASGHRR